MESTHVKSSLGGRKLNSLLSASLSSWRRQMSSNDEKIPLNNIERRKEQRIIGSRDFMHAVFFIWLYLQHLYDLHRGVYYLHEYTALLSRKKKQMKQKSPPVPDELEPAPTLLQFLRRAPVILGILVRSSKKYPSDIFCRE